MTACSAKDLERAREFLQYECCWSADGSAAFAEDVAKYAALVRRETLEECARLARANDDRETEREIRALLEDK